VAQFLVSLGGGRELPHLVRHSLIPSRSPAPLRLQSKSIALLQCSTSCVETAHKTCRSPRTEGIEAMAQASGPGLAWLAPGLSFALRNLKPKPEEAKPAQHYYQGFERSLPEVLSPTT
jgi:hypothetical protein